MPSSEVLLYCEGEGWHSFYVDNRGNKYNRRLGIVHRQSLVSYNFILLIV